MVPVVLERAAASPAVQWPELAAGVVEHIPPVIPVVEAILAPVAAVGVVITTSREFLEAPIRAVVVVPADIIHFPAVVAVQDW